MANPKLPEEVKRQHRKEYMELTKERRAQYWRLYYLRNSDQIKERNYKYNAEHKEARRKAQATYREKNKDKIAEYNRKYLIQHYDEILDKNRERDRIRREAAKSGKEKGQVI